ncbi:MAG TPA: pilus assembly protein PilZ [Anaeromyxobacteraceae bacterium]|nr:pilus assembly protein PilZ [Anaeromyxobacteraceae bacterium]
MTPSSGQLLSRALLVGQDAEVAAALHLHLERASWSLFCLPSPEALDGVLRAIAPHAIILVLPAQPDASWGGALTAAAGAARVGVRVVVVAPSREVVEPLAAVAGAERALARAEVLARPLSVVERAGPVASPNPAPAPARAAPASPRPPPADPAQGGAPPPRSNVDLMALIDEELVDEPRSRPHVTRVEVNVSLVSEHNFYVGPTRRVDSGGVFISTVLPPPVGTRLQVRLGLADGRKLDLEGEVVFIREKSAISGRQPAGCGIKLYSLPGWAVEAIDRFLLARPPIVYVPR